MSTETGIKYIKNRFSYNAELGIYYKNIKEGFMLVAKFSYKNVDIYKLYENLQKILMAKLKYIVSVQTIQNIVNA